MNTVSKKRPMFPILVKRGSCVVKIYSDRKPTATYYRVVYYLGGQRRRLNFNDLEEATREAEAKASQLSRGEIDAMQVTSQDRLIYGRAAEALREFGISVDLAAAEYAEARKILNGGSIVEAARFFSRYQGRGIQSKPIADAVDEILTAKERSGGSGVYLSDLRYRLGGFKAAFNCDVNALTPDDVAGFFDSLDLSPRSYNNFLGTLRTFFGFSQKQGWLSKEANLLERVDKRKEVTAAVEIFSPAQLAKLFEHASEELSPCLALGAFAGLRAEEILRLEWKDLERRPGFVEVAAHKAKTATRRLVPLTPNLAQWLALAPRISAKIWPHSKPWLFESIRDAVVSVNENRKPKTVPLFVWKTNALRHSYISYRLADIQDANRVALEAGNSPQMIFRHYRELVTPDEAKRWFSIKPKGDTKIIPIAAHR